ncbi:GNAT family N-acetyltransferase [Candidatus Thorarchaeota archaeon]|nr:MAG: GNAT family N-acetyltransferase [Candidatus Thorarchaeota archaeon]
MKPQDLGDGLVMRNASAEDLPAILEHYRVVHGAAVIDGMRAIFEKHPRFSWEDCFIIVKQDSGEVVSTLLTMQGSWAIDGVQVLAVEMEAVGTLEAYRYRGFMRLLNDAFEKRAAELQPVIQTIAGIPNFYRNFGYEYAAPLGGGYPVSPNLVPKIPDGEVEPVTIEEVDAKDFKEFLTYREKHLPSRTWYRTIHLENARYLIYKPTSIEQEAFYFFLVKEKGKTVGVFFINNWENKVDIAELYLDDYKHLDPVLRYNLAKAREWKGIPVRVVPPNQKQVHEFVKVRTQCKDITRYAWYVKIPSVPRFLETIGPLFEDRLRNTEFHNYGESLTIMDYKHGYTLSFENGKFQSIIENPEKKIEEYHLRIPQGALTRLLMGYETLDELMGHEPDVICVSAMKPVVRALFPKLNATVDPFY